MYSFCGSQASTVINTFDSNVPSVLAGGSNTGPTFMQQITLQLVH